MRPCQLIHVGTIDCVSTDSLTAVRPPVYYCMCFVCSWTFFCKRPFLCRDDAIVDLPLEHKMSALTPVQEAWPMKMLPPFATPPKAPKWRF